LRQRGITISRAPRPADPGDGRRRAGGRIDDDSRDADGFYATRQRDPMRRLFYRSRFYPDSDIQQYSTAALPHYRITALPHYQIRNTKPCAACRNPEAYEISAAHCAPDARSRSKIPEPDVKANRHA
jgi:hypothetical protein